MAWWVALGRGVTALNKFGRGLGMVNGVAKEATGQIKEFENAVSNLANTLGRRWYEMNDIAFKTARTMAMSREQAIRYNKQLIDSTRELAAQYGVTAKEMADFQKNYSEAIGRNIVLTREQLSHMSALSKITDQATAAKLVDEFDKVGVGIARATAYTGRLQERAKALGVSPAKATKTMADNIKLAASYSFRNGVNDIEKMALKATSMRMDMNAIMSATEKFADIEGAISTSANIQMLGGSFAREFSNPMGAMFEAQADPEAFMKRIERTIQGKGKYDAKTGAVTFDPVTMRMMRELAKNLGVTVDQITNPAMAGVQNEKVMAEFEKNANKNGFNDKDREAIKNLSRTNVDEKTGKHFVTYLEDGKEKTAFVEDLTQKQLELAKDSNMTEEGLWSDVQDIKTILERVHGRARETKSMKEGVEGTKSWWDAQLVNLQNFYMPFISDIFNGFTNTLGNQYFSDGGIVKPIKASLGTIVPGNRYTGDRVHAMVNSGEMILNQGEQKGLFDLLKGIATTGAMIYGGNKLGNRFGINGLGYNAALGGLVNGGGLGVGNILGSGAAMFMGNRMMMRGMTPMGMGINKMGGTLTLMNPTVLINGQTIMNGSIGDGSLVEELEDIADAASEATKNTRSFSSRLRDLSRKNTFLGRRAMGLRNLKAGRLKLGRKIANRSKAIGSGVSNWFSSSRGVNWLRESQLNKFLKTLKHGTFDQRMIGPRGGQFRMNGKLIKAEKVGGKLTQKALVGKGWFQQLGRDVKSLVGGGKTAVTQTIAQEASTAAKTANAAANTTKAIGNGSGLLKGLGKAGKFLGKAAGPIGAALAIGSAVSDMSSASSQYDAKIDEIEKSGMSELDKARAKDRATKEKNATYGNSIGTAAGAAIGGTLGMALGPLGAIAGGWLGSKVGGFLGKGVGGLFGGSEEKKFKKEQERLFGNRDAIKSNDESVKILSSIDNKMSIITTRGIGLSPKTIASPSISKVGIKKGIKTAAGLALGLPFGPLGIAAGALLGSKFGKKDVSRGIGKVKDTLMSPIDKLKSKISLEPLATKVESIPVVSNFLKVKPSKQEITNTSNIGIGKGDINLNVSGTIKLEGGGKSADFDLAKLLDTDEFKRQLTDIITKRLNENSNSGKRNMESERNNMASQYNRSGK